MRLIEDEKRIPNVGEICVLKLNNIKKLDITTGIDGEITPNSLDGLSKENLKRKAELYGVDYLLEFDGIDELSELDECDSIGSYRLVFNDIEGNNTDLETFVEYLGDGIFRDVLSGVLFKSFCEEYTDGMANEYSCEESSIICETYFDDVLKGTTSRDLIDNREYFTKVPLIIDLSSACLENVNADGIRRIMEQNRWKEISYICGLNIKAKKDLNRQIDLLFKMDEYLAYAENEFRKRIK